MNKEVKYGYILFSKDLKKFYSEKDGEDGVSISMELATIFNTEMKARNKRDEFYNTHKLFFDIKGITVEYNMFNI